MFYLPSCCKEACWMTDSEYAITNDVLIISACFTLLIRKFMDCSVCSCVLQCQSDSENFTTMLLWTMKDNERKFLIKVCCHAIFSHSQSNIMWALDISAESTVACFLKQWMILFLGLAYFTTYEYNFSNDTWKDILLFINVYIPSLHTPPLYFSIHASTASRFIIDSIDQKLWARPPISAINIYKHKEKLVIQQLIGIIVSYSTVVLYIGIMEVRDFLH